MPYKSAALLQTKYKTIDTSVIYQNFIILQRKENGMSKVINTVTGPIEAKDLGWTLMHEHIAFGFAGYHGDLTLAPFDEDVALASNMKLLDPLHNRYGFKTIVDATTNECGRDPEFMAKVSKASDMNIICSTGYYFEPASAYEYWRFASNFGNVEDQIYEMMLKEVTEGIGKTGIKAGVIKLASSANEITEYERKFFLAAARVNKEVGTPIITHTQLGTCGPEQAKLLVEHGANPEDISIGHMCGNLDMKYHEDTLQYGVFESLDRFGIEGELYHTPTDEQRSDFVMELLAKGYEDRIMMSHDAPGFMYGRPAPEPAEDAPENHTHFLNIPTRVLPMLRERGITDAQLEKIFVKNPARHLG